MFQVMIQSVADGKKLLCCILLPQSDLLRWHWSNKFVISILQCSCIFNFSLCDFTSPSYPPPLLISRLFSLMPLKATPLRLVALSIETLPNQIQTQGLWEAPCDLALQIRRLLWNGTINRKCDPTLHTVTVVWSQNKAIAGIRNASLPILTQILIWFCILKVKWFISDTWRKCGLQMTWVNLHLTCSLFFPSRLELQKLKVDLCCFIKDTNLVTRFSLFLTTKATFLLRMAFDNWQHSHHCVKTLMTFSRCHSSVTKCDSWISVAKHRRVCEAGAAAEQITVKH